MEPFSTAHNTNLHYKQLNTRYDMLLASGAKGLQGSNQGSESCTGSDCSRVDDSLPDTPTQQDTAATAPIGRKLPTITMDYERIDTYLTEIGASEAPGLAPVPAPAPTQPAPAQAVDEQNWTQVSNNRGTKILPARPPEKRRKGPDR